MARDREGIERLLQRAERVLDSIERHRTAGTTHLCGNMRMGIEGTIRIYRRTLDESHLDRLQAQLDRCDAKMVEWLRQSFRPPKGDEE